MSMKVVSRIGVTLALALWSAAGLGASPAKPNIVLVHGAFADASGWGKVILILQAHGYPVIAVQNPLQSFDGDIANTKRVLDDQAGPVVLVGHSYGGAVISGAAAGDPKVKALVYLAAIAPEAGEPVGALLGKYPIDLATAQKVDKAGYVYIDPAKFHQVFCADLSASEAAVGAFTQKPINGPIFAASVPQVAWKTIPSWYVVSKQDHAINPELERYFAKRMGAKTSEVDASHVAFISHAEEIAAVIEQAAATAQ